MFVVSRNPNGTPGPVIEIAQDEQSRLMVDGQRVWAVRVYGSVTALETGRGVFFIATDDYLAWEQLVATSNGNQGRW